MTVNERLTALRAEMKKEGISAYVILNSDPHIGEYVPKYRCERSFISGFTGSAGTAVVTADTAGLWTDGRYYLQAEKELSGSEFLLFRASDAGVIKPEDFVCEHVTAGQTAGVNGTVYPLAGFVLLRDKLAVKGARLRSDKDLVSRIWTEGRPPLSDMPAYVYDTEYAGETAAQKLGRLREKMREEYIDLALFTGLDDVNYLCNIRGEDVKNTPVVTAFASVTPDTATLYIRSDKCPPNVRRHLDTNGFSVKDYEQIYSDVKMLPAGHRVSVCYAGMNAALFDEISPQAVRVPRNRTIVSEFKSQKNPTEIAWARSRQIEDGAAVAKAVFRLKAEAGSEAFTEQSVADMLAQLRSNIPGNKGLSFGTIAGYEQNGAIVHYRPDPETGGSTLGARGLLLIDSGGQYLGATTDITRTIALGPTTDEQKRDFTLVLKSFIALQSVRFLEGTPGKSLDILARKIMWDAGLDYKHGTGHGVGSFMGVHESPPNFADSSTPLAVGMIISVEPGIYKKDKHGIRTENLVTVVPDKQIEGVGRFFRFEPLTVCPIDLDCVLPDMLTPEETAWLNSYHADVCKKLLPYMNTEQSELLVRATREI